MELKLLGCAVAVGLVQLLWAAAAARRQQGLVWAAGPRDEPMPISGVAARLDRAFRNFMETFPLFATAVIAAYLAAKLGPLTMWGTALYVIARALYVPIYAAGIARIRSLVWFVAMAGLVMVVAALFR
ncbi:MAPEG family protein [Phenylobacterium sp.]|jgi:uncharacterized MAPEG superfamily protein|uniref:MAPEG family protein n=1 Tax=Phenylobacterium sp. TaxID=1871053 RepID=UPI002F3E6C66